MNARIAVVLNGNAKSVNDAVIATIEHNLVNGDVFTSRHLDEAPIIAKTIVERGYGTVLTGGGDGTFTVTATEVMKAASRAGSATPRFGLLKLGTGNALVGLAGASPLADKKCPPGADTIPAHAAVQKLYLVNVEGIHTPFAGVGADAQILADYNLTKSQLVGTPFEALGTGLSGYSLAALSRSLPAILLSEMPTIRVINEGAEAWPVDPDGIHRDRPIRAGETIYEGKARMAAFSTIPYYGFGMRLFPFAQADSGHMQLRVSRMGPPQFLANVRGVWNGSYYDQRFLSDYYVESFRLECETPIEFQIGGDSQGTRTELRAEVTKQSLDLVDFTQIS